MVLFSPHHVGVKPTVQSDLESEGTTEYYKTKDSLHVKHVLGHRNIKNTLIYTCLVHFTEENEYVTKVTRDIEMAQRLLDNGFDYELTSPDGLMFFRKRK